MQTKPTPGADDDALDHPSLEDPLAAALERIGQKIHERSLQRAAQSLEATEGPPTPPMDKTPNPRPRGAEKAHDTPQAEQAKVVVLTPWTDDKRAAPNAIFRSALFPALNNKLGRKFVKEQKVYSVGGLEVTFTGEQFDQTDLDVYLEILNFAKGTPLGQPVKFSAYAMLKALGWGTGGNQHKRLHSALVRLCGGVVDATDHKARYFGQLLFGGIRDEITMNYEITLNPNYAVLFGFGQWSAIDLTQRRALARNSTAKALHAYYSTHTGPSLHRYETLAGVAGLQNKNRREMKASLIRAHEELKRIGFLLDYEAKENGIEARTIMTPGQQQHAARKMTKPPRSKSQHGKPDD